MVIGEIKWKLVKDTYFFSTTMFYLADDGNYLVYFGKEKQIKTLIDDLNELVRKGCAMWIELGEYEFGLDKLSKCPTQTWYSIHQTLYSLEPWGVIKESKKSARKSIKESRGQTVAELLQNASSKTIVHIYNDSTSDEFVGTNDQLKGEFSRFLYYTVSVWNIGNDKIANIYCY